MTGSLGIGKMALWERGRGVQGATLFSGSIAFLFANMIVRCFRLSAGGGGGRVVEIVAVVGVSSWILAVRCGEMSAFSLPFFSLQSKIVNSMSNDGKG